MARSVNKIKGVLLTLIHIIHLDCVTLDGNSLLFLKVHRVKDLILHITRIESVCHFQHSICKRTLTVVDVRDDAKISCFLHCTCIIAAKIAN